MVLTFDSVVKYRYQSDIGGDKFGTLHGIEHVVLW